MQGQSEEVTEPKLWKIEKEESRSGRERGNQQRHMSPPCVEMDRTKNGRTSNKRMGAN